MYIIVLSILNLHMSTESIAKKQVKFFVCVKILGIKKGYSLPDHKPDMLSLKCSLYLSFIMLAHLKGRVGQSVFLQLNCHGYLYSFFSDCSKDWR